MSNDTFSYHPINYRKIVTNKQVISDRRGKKQGRLNPTHWGGISRELKALFSGHKKTGEIPGLFNFEYVELITVSSA
ncbi:hypothetical protein GCM10007876_34010 [Litoribrevibacter albus]|uniref:Uncharacterized protein n=1 Tax=Litoribrevibacter albus TaxID=1473156 RepID=A0AA37W7U8_9GAMM|nr:hypothetical protein GCM10007876_34010 [Litoribrevibacter albus]